MPGTATTNLPLSDSADDVIGNAAGSTIRVSMARLAALLGTLQGPAYGSVTQLQADTAWPAGAIGSVYGGTAAQIGVYRKSGAPGSGSWSRIGDLPVSSITAAQLSEKAALADLTAEIAYRRAAIRDAGIMPLANVTGRNSITATLTPSMIEGGATLANTSTVELIPAETSDGPVQLSLDGATPVPVRDAAGAELQVGALLAGRSYFLRRRGSTWRIIAGGISSVEMRAEAQARMEGDQAEAQLRLAGDRAVGVHALSAVGGSATAITAELGFPEVPGETKVILVPAAESTGPVTLRLGTGPIRSIMSADSASLSAGDLKAGIAVLLRLSAAGDWRLVGLARGDIAAAVSIEARIRASEDERLDVRTSGIQRTYDDRGYAFGIISADNDLLLAVTDSGRAQAGGRDLATVPELDAAFANLEPRLLQEGFEPIDRPLVAAITTGRGALLAAIDIAGVGTFGAAPLGCFPTTQVVAGVSHIAMISYAGTIRQITDGAGERAPHWFGPRLRFIETVGGLDAVRAVGPDLGLNSYEPWRYPRIAILAGMGQSLMAGSNAEGSVSNVTAIAPARTLMFADGRFAPLMEEPGNADDTSRQLTPAGAYTREQPMHQVGVMMAASGLGPDEGLLLTNHARGGYNIGQLVKNGSSTIYARWLARLESFAVWAATNEVAISRVVMYWQQGQSGGVSGGIDGEQQYYNLMMQLWSDISADVSVRAGATVPTLIVIAPVTHRTTGASWHPKNPGNLGINGAQTRLGFEQPQRFALAGPDYYIARQDGTHMIADGYAVIGGHMARATKRWTDSNGAWRPLHCTGGVRSGAQVVLTFAGGVGPMVFDTYDPAQGPVVQGFRPLPTRGLLWYQDGGQPVSIQSVEITGNRQITVTLSGDPGAGVPGWIAIGVGPYEGTNEGFLNRDPTTGTGGGTNIRTESGETNGLGHPLNDWACQQVIRLT